MGVDLDELNTDFGRFFVSWIRANGHDRVSHLPLSALSPSLQIASHPLSLVCSIQLMHSLGSNFVEFMR